MVALALRTREQPLRRVSVAFDSRHSSLGSPLNNIHPFLPMIKSYIGKSLTLPSIHFSREHFRHFNNTIFDIISFPFEHFLNPFQQIPHFFSGTTCNCVNAIALSCSCSYNDLVTVSFWIPTT